MYPSARFLIGVKLELIKLTIESRVLSVIKSPWIHSYTKQSRARNFRIYRQNYCFYHNVVAGNSVIKMARFSSGGGGAGELFESVAAVL